jgi:hypothetical protein
MDAFLSRGQGLTGLAAEELKLLARAAGLRNMFLPRAHRDVPAIPISTTRRCAK